MESGLEDRNNITNEFRKTAIIDVSMESGLEDRNNFKKREFHWYDYSSLNGVRPRRPEQYVEAFLGD